MKRIIAALVLIITLLAITTPVDAGLRRGQLRKSLPRVENHVVTTECAALPVPESRYGWLVEFSFDGVTWYSLVTLPGSSGFQTFSFCGNSGVVYIRFVEQVEA